MIIRFIVSPYILRNLKMKIVVKTKKLSTFT